MPILSPRLLERLAMLDVGVRHAGGGHGPGERPAGQPGVGTLFHEHRTYSPGDDVRYVDWNAYGRLRSLHVKVFEVEENLDVHLLVDRSGSMGSGRGSKLETGCRMAAMVGAVALARGAVVRLQFLPPAGRRRTDRLHTFQGRASTQPLLNALGNATPGGAADLGRSLEATFPRLRRRGFALLVSDFLAGEGATPNSWRRAVDFLAFRRVELTCLHVVAPEERDPQVDGALRLRDAETGATLVVDVDEGVLAEYRQRFDRWVRGVEAYLGSKEARHLLVDSVPGDEETLLRVLLRGRVLR